MHGLMAKEAPANGSQPKRDARKRQLTELFVKKVKPEKRTFLVWDSKQHGLALRVQPTGSRAWKVIYSRHGRPRWLHLGNANAIALGDARTLAAEAMLAVARGKDPAAEKKAERGAGTFAELAERYLEEHAKKKNKSWAQSDYLIRRYVLPRWGKLQASTITRGDVKVMLKHISAKILANQVLAAVSSIFTWALREDILSANPCKLVERNETTSRDRVLADSEVPEFWSAFGEAGLEGRALKVVLLLGQRPGEVAHMRREHIKDGWWELPGKPVPAEHWPGTKNGATHSVWLPAPVRSLIDSDATTGFVFGSRGRPVRGLDAVMRDICKRLGVVKPVRPHDLRRTFGTRITKLKFGRSALNRILNHKEGGIADVYDAHDYSAENKLIMETVAGHILALAEGRPEESNVVQMTVKR